MNWKYNPVLTAVYWTLLSLLLAHPGLKAQPFDTLLAQFNSIIELYPLADSTYILIGRGDHYGVGRIDSKAKFLWFVELPQGKKSSVYDYQVNLSPTDTAIQILFGDFECDYYPGRQFESVTISIDGKVRDSQSWPGAWGRPYLLSGNMNRPRIGVIGEENCILINANSDTILLMASNFEKDTSLMHYRRPRTMAICPNGDILIGNDFFTVYFLHKLETRYEIYDVSFHSPGSEIICVEDSSFIEKNEHRLLRWVNGSPEESFRTEAYLSSYNIHWRDPFLQVYIESDYGQDTILLLDKHLAIQSAFPVPELPGFQHHVVTPNEIFTIGGGNIYFDHGSLISENRQTHAGPVFYDVEFLDIEAGPYDSVYLVYGGFYHYSIPHATVTIRNNCTYTINDVAIGYLAPFSICGDTIWQREITSMDLQPGESDEFKIYDIFIRQDFPYIYDDCFYLLRPDLHLDDYFEDNTFCKKLELLPRVADPFPIHRKETIIADQLTFLSPEKIDFQLRILSLGGQLIFSAKANTYSNFTVNLEALPPGMFVLQYTIPATGQVYAEKMIKPY
jgi:hypothetical protein